MDPNTTVVAGREGVKTTENILVENEKPSEIYNIEKKKKENKFIYMIELLRISSYVRIETLLCAV